MVELVESLKPIATAVGRHIVEKVDAAKKGVSVEPAPVCIY
jgi:hypothetical protein